MTTTTPIIGEAVGNVTQADIPNYFHLVTRPDVIDFYPTWKLADGQLVPVTEEEAQEAYLTLRVKY